MDEIIKVLKNYGFVGKYINSKNKYIINGIAYLIIVYNTSIKIEIYRDKSKRIVDEWIWIELDIDKCIDYIKKNSTLNTYLRKYKIDKLLNE